MDSIQKTISYLEEAILNGKRGLFTNKVLVDQKLILELIDDLKTILPQEITQAKKIVSEKQKVLEDARKEANKILERAKSEASRMVDESNITQSAKEQAKEIIKAGENEAKVYTMNVISQLQSVIERLLDNLNKEKNKLEKTL